MELIKRWSYSSWNMARRGQVPLEFEMLAFIFVSALDFLMTAHLLCHPDINFVESNPLAVVFINHWGLKGMLWFKIGTVAVVIGICQIIFRERPKLAQRVLNLGTGTVGSVVVYSYFLYNAALQLP